MTRASRRLRMGSLVGFVVLVATAAVLSGSVMESHFTETKVPAAPGSLAPVLSQGEDGALLLSWLEPAGTGHALRFSAWRDGQWRSAVTVVTSDSLFVNW